MRSSAAARRYAKALFSLARDESAVPAVRSQLDDFSKLLAEHPPMRDALFRPLHPVKERRAVLAAVSEQAGLGATVRKFLVFLVDQRRLVDFEGILAEYARLADEASGRIRAEVVSSSPLSDEQQSRLRSALAAQTGREIELDIKVDASLIGGAIAQVGGMVFDGSLRTQLSQLRDTLTRGQ
jgi:F-type H+-transporting ATPase subunit delta